MARIKQHNTKITKKKKDIASALDPIEKEIKNPLWRISIKFIFLFLLLLIGIVFSDQKGYFAPDETNNHTLRKWDSYYDFTKKNQVDILLIGNSHLYTGINPKNLSTALGANAFILASPGTHMADNYFALVEAVKQNKPELVVIETYGIKTFNPYELSEGALSDQFKSFSARKDFLSKLMSTPSLFTTENYLFAWSNTLRNKNFIFTDQEQLKKNKEIIDNAKKINYQKLYLGRFATYQTGINDTVLQRYETEGSPVDGNAYSYNEYTEIYLDKIVTFCKEKDIEMMFLTLPMYYQHIKDYSVWKNKLAEILNKYPNPWLDMQEPYSIADFPPYCFQNTYTENQHMTYAGSLIATYMLANFIKSEHISDLPNRKKEINWHRVFYGDEGYFENCSPSPNDTKNKIICSNLQIRNVMLDEVILISMDENSSTIMAKIDRNQIDDSIIKGCLLQLVIEYSEDNEIKTAAIVLQYDQLHKVPEQAIFIQNIKQIAVQNIVDGFIQCR